VIPYSPDPKSTSDLLKLPPESVILDDGSLEARVLTSFYSTLTTIKVESLSVQVISQVITSGAIVLPISLRTQLDIKKLGALSVALDKTYLMPLLGWRINDLKQIL
jgi:hypothetical protein